MGLRFLKQLDASGQQGGESRQRNGRRQPALSGRPRVLCVDDEPNVLKGLQLTLRKDYRVELAESGAAALARVTEAPGFAVILSDMRMPQMNGAQVLAEVRQREPMATRMLLTGQSDLDSAISAINDGRIFRFLTKPCPPERLLVAFADAAEQYRLRTSEQELLEKTVKGSVHTLIEILGLVSPTAFGRAMRIRRYVVELCDALGITQRWHIEMAAMLGYLGYVSLPPHVVEKLSVGRQLAPEEMEMVSRVPALTRSLLEQIPRLEPVLETMSATRLSYDGSGSLPSAPRGEQIPLGSRVLRVALDYDSLDDRQRPARSILEIMAGRTTYDPRILEAMARLRAGSAGKNVVREIRLVDVRKGMVLADDVLAPNGMCIVARGQVVSHGILERLHNFAQGVGIEEPLRVREQG